MFTQVMKMRRFYENNLSVTSSSQVFDGKNNGQRIVFWRSEH